MNNIISINQLSKSYNGTKAVDDVTLDVKTGEFFGFLGPNGAGKTTTIRILTGMLQADSGSAIIDGKNLSQKEEIAQIIGVLPESRGFYGWMSAKEYLSYFANLYGLKKSIQKETIIQILNSVHMEKYSNTSISSYSRGMKQRIALARALINKPKILFLDEPTLGLDPQGQVDIQRILLDLHKEGVTIFLSSHLLPEVSNLCTYLAIIHHGKLVAKGALEELSKNSNTKQKYSITIDKAFADFEVLRDLKNIKHELINTNTIEISFTGNENEANKLLDNLRKHQIIIRKFGVTSDTLTDIFLEVTKN